METTTQGQAAYIVGTKEWIKGAFVFYGARTNELTSTFDKLQAGAQSFAQLIVDITPEGYDRVEALKSLRHTVMLASAAIIQKSNA